jgi:hypothetical protein
MILYLKDLENSTKNLLDIINTFSKVVRQKVNLQKSVAFLYMPTMNRSRKKYRKIIPSTITSKIYRNKLNKGSERPL